jgi:hypothetical protein
MENCLQSLSLVSLLLSGFAPSLHLSFYSCSAERENWYSMKKEKGGGGGRSWLKSEARTPAGVRRLRNIVFFDKKWKYTGGKELLYKVYSNSKDCLMKTRVEYTYMNK